MAIVTLPQRAQSIFCCSKSLVRVARLLLFVFLSGHFNDMDHCRAATEAVDAAKTLDHGVERCEVADHVVGVEIDAHLAGRGCDQIVRMLRWQPVEPRTKAIEQSTRR